MTAQGSHRIVCGHNPVNWVDPLGLIDSATERALRRVAESAEATQALSDALQELENLAQRAHDNIEQSHRAAERLRASGQHHAADAMERQASRLRGQWEDELGRIMEDVIGRQTNEDVVKALNALKRRGGVGEGVADILRRLRRYAHGAKGLAMVAKRLKIARGIPLFGALIAVFFLPADVQAKGLGPAIANAIADGTPVFGAQKLLVETIQGGDAIRDKEDMPGPRAACPDPMIGGVVRDIYGIPLGADIAPVSGGGAQ